MAEVKEQEVGEGEVNVLDREPEAEELQELAVAGGVEAVAAHSGLLVACCHVAEDRCGLRVAECDAPSAPGRWGPVHRVHAAGSYHYQHRAADISGPEPNMARFAHWVIHNHQSELAELIHNPGFSVKNGQRVPSSFWGAQTWAGHRNHVHLAV